MRAHDLRRDHLSDAVEWLASSSGVTLARRGDRFACEWPAAFGDTRRTAMGFTAVEALLGAYLTARATRPHNGSEES